jgi:hypothetical protein
MPIHQGIDAKGTYYQYGQTGKKYYYTTPKGETIALQKAKKQTMAIAIKL